MAFRKAVKKLNQSKNLIVSDFYTKHKSAEVIAEYYHLDLPQKLQVNSTSLSYLQRVNEIKQLEDGLLSDFYEKHKSAE